MENFEGMKEKISEGFIKIKTFVMETTKKVVRIIKEHKEIAILSVLVVILVLLLAIVVIPRTQKNIREKEVSSMVMNRFSSEKKIVFVPDGELEDTIKKEKNIAIALVDPNDKYYDIFEKALLDKDKMKYYEDKLYFYPIIYNKKKTMDFYNVTTGITLLYFEDKKEVNRVSLDSKKEIELYLVDHLNSLNMSNSKQLPSAKDKEKETENDQTESSTTESSEKEEEPIDELKSQDSNDNGENTDE